MRFHTRCQFYVQSASTVILRTTGGSGRQLMVTVSVAIGLYIYILSLFPHPPFSPSLISLMVCVDVKHHSLLSGRLWPSRPAAVRGTSVPANPLQLSFLSKSCGLWTLSCDFDPHNNYETWKWLIAAHLNGSSDRYQYNLTLPPPQSIPPPVPVPTQWIRLMIAQCGR